MDIERMTMKLIVESGKAKSKAMEAMASARNDDFEKARELHQEACKCLEAAHEIQTDFIQTESDGELNEMSLLLVHAQDHLMSALLIKDLSLELISLHEKITLQQ